MSDLASRALEFVERLERDDIEADEESLPTRTVEWLRRGHWHGFIETGVGADRRIIDVVVAGVNMQEPSRTFVELAEIGGDRRLPVFIGPAEADAIAFALRGQPMRRPMTHDALKQAIDAIGGQLVSRRKSVSRALVLCGE